MSQNENFEPKLKNRFMVVFPDSFKIEPYLIRTVKLPTVLREGGVMKFTRLSYSDCEISFMAGTKNKLFKSLIDTQQNNKKFTFIVQLLDPIGIVTEEYAMHGSFIKSIEFDRMDYGDKGVMEIHTKFNVDYFTIV